MTNASSAPPFSTESRICRVVSATNGTPRWNPSKALITAGDNMLASSPPLKVDRMVTRKFKPVLLANGLVYPITI